MRHTLHTSLFTSLVSSLLLAGCSSEPGSEETPTQEDMMVIDGQDMSSRPDMSSTADMPIISPDMSTSPVPVSSGKSDCGSLPTGETISCQPSQYCADSLLNRCEQGCLSDANCPGNESCVKESGQNSGLCQRKPGEQGQLPPDPSRTGQSACGFGFDGAPVQCQPSQYCNDSVLAQCQAGCLSDFNCPDGEQCNKPEGRAVGVCEKSPAPDPCLGVSCGNDEVCQQGSCVPLNPCAGVSCDTGQMCVAGLCVNTDLCAGVMCQGDQMCVGGVCVDVDPCAGVMCPNGQACTDGLCVNVDPCAGVSCGSGQVCEDGACVPSRTDCIPNATAQDGCPSDQICIYDENDDTFCFKFPACDAQNQCDVGLFGAVCSTEFISGKDPQCLPETCTNETHCPVSWYCVIDPGFPAGFCDDGDFGSFCSDDQDCDAGLSCDTFTGICG